MTTLYILNPAVGEWGPKTVVTNRPEMESGRALMWEVAYLEFHFDGWLGDELMEATPCYIVTERLARAIRDAGLTGTRFDFVEVTTSEQWAFHEPERVRALPPFERLIPTGDVRYGTDGAGISWSGDDICLGICEGWSPPQGEPTIANIALWGAPPYELIVSERCLGLLRQFQLKHCEVQELRVPS